MSDFESGGPSSSERLREVQQTSPAYRRQTGNETPQPQQDPDAEGQNRPASDAYAREPAVSIAANTVHLQPGDILEEEVTRLDAEARPVIRSKSLDLALRPDAGLKPGDRVALQVLQTSTSLEANLLRRNEQRLEPPIKLHLTITAVHTENPEFAITPEGPPAGPRPDGAAAQGSYSGTPATTTDPLPASLLAGIEPAALASGTTGPAGAATTSHGAVFSSADMAALIANAEADSVSEGSAGSAETALQGLTGTPHAAFTTHGISVSLQAIDPSVSNIPPAQLLQISSSTPLTLQQVRALDVPLLTLPGAQDGFAQIESDRGALIVTASTAQQLVGQSVVVDPAGVLTLPAQPSPSDKAGGGTQQAAADQRVRPQAQPAKQTADPVSTSVASTAATDTIPAADLPQFSAKLTRVSPPASAARHGKATVTETVRLTIPPYQAAADGTRAPDLVPPTGQQAVRVDAVHVIRAFLASDGPRNDLHLDTSHGRISVTLSGIQRPQVGDILWLAATEPADPALAQGGTPRALSVSAPHASVAAGLEAAAGGQALAPALPVLREVWQVLNTATPQAAEAFILRSAKGGGKLINSAAFLLAALKGGGPTQYWGDSVQRALANRADLLTRLREGTGRLMGRAQETVGDWKRLLLPFDASGADAPLLALLYDEGSADGRDSADDAQTDDMAGREVEKRFLVEVRFSVLGPVQLEGRVKGKVFTLTLRTAAPLDPPLEAALTRIFADSLAANGFDGSFQTETTTDFPIDAFAGLENDRHFT